MLDLFSCLKTSLKLKTKDHYKNVPNLIPSTCRLRIACGLTLRFKEHQQLTLTVRERLLTSSSASSSQSLAFPTHPCSVQKWRLGDAKTKPLRKIPAGSDKAASTSFYQVVVDHEHQDLYICFASPAYAYTWSLLCKNDGNEGRHRRLEVVKILTAMIYCVGHSSIFTVFQQQSWDRIHY